MFEKHRRDPLFFRESVRQELASSKGFAYTCEQGVH